MIRFAILALVLGVTGTVLADIRVQDVARLKGQRTNKLVGWGLVVGLDGSGDTVKSPATMRALSKLHEVFHSPVTNLEELKANNTVAIVMIEATIPEFGAREGQTLDVVVSAVGSAKSVTGGRLLTTPLQDSMLSRPEIAALATGRVDALDPKNPRSGIVRGGGTVEEEFLYHFILDGHITLVIDDAKAGFNWAQVVARTINFELANPAEEMSAAGVGARIVVEAEPAVAIDAKNVRVRIPAAELSRPAGFISRILQARIFAAPDEAARVLINRITNQISFSENVTITPTVLHLPGLGTVSIGGGNAAPTSPMVGLDGGKPAAVGFKELLDTLSKLQLPPEQVVQAIEHLHRSGALNAQLLYTE